MPRYFDFRVSIIDIKPEVWRRFLLPETSTFAGLHEAIQDSFGWESDHLFEFRDKGGRQRIARADFDDDFDDEQVPIVGKLKLGSFFARKGTKCCYVYDFGDDWRHTVELRGIVEFPERFKRRLLDGARACPLEDCGGVYGYEQCLEIVGMSEDDIKKLGDDAEEMAERREWIGDWEPEAFDLGAAKKDFDK